MVDSEQRECGVLHRGRKAILYPIASFHHHVGLDRPVPPPACCARRWRKVADGGNGLAGQASRQPDLVSAGSYADWVPCLRRRFNLVIGIITDRKVITAAKAVLVRVSGRNYEQSLSLLIPRGACGELINLARPGRRSAVVRRVFVCRAGHRKGSASRRIRLDGVYCLENDGAQQMVRILTSIRDDLNGLEPVLDLNRHIALDDREQISV